MTLAPRGPSVVLRPLRPKLSRSPGAILIDFRNRKPILISPAEQYQRFEVFDREPHLRLTINGEIAILKSALSGVDGTLRLEFGNPGIGNRIDSVLVATSRLGAPDCEFLPQPFRHRVSKPPLYSDGLVALP